MAPLHLEIESQIENLRGFKDDLEEIFWALEDRSGPTGHALGVAIAQVGQRMAALEATARHLGAEVVLLPDLGVDEARALERALLFLDGEVALAANDPSAKLWGRIRRLLAAADDVLLAACRGKAAAADDDATPRAVVIPLVRSRG
jgi:hypothetical protein